LNAILVMASLIFTCDTLGAARHVARFGRITRIDHYKGKCLESPNSTSIDEKENNTTKSIINLRW